MMTIFQFCWLWRVVMVIWFATIGFFTLRTFAYAAQVESQTETEVGFDDGSVTTPEYGGVAVPSARGHASDLAGVRTSFPIFAGFLAAKETVTLYRGVNNSHVAFESAEQGLVRANGGLATPLEHNTVPGATLRSPYTSWTTDPAVAENFALRPNGGGVVIRAEVPVSQTVPSPNLKTVLLRQNGQIVSESVRRTPKTGPGVKL